MSHDQLQGHAKASPPVAVPQPPTTEAVAPSSATFPIPTGSDTIAATARPPSQLILDGGDEAANSPGDSSEESGDSAALDYIRLPAMLDSRSAVADAAPPPPRVCERTHPIDHRHKCNHYNNTRGR